MDNFLQTLISALNTHIETVVTKKFEQLMEGHKAIAQLDTDREEVIREMIEDVVDDKLSDHNNEYDHDDIVSREYLSDLVYDAVNDYDMSDIIENAVAEKLKNTKFRIVGGTIETEV